jgi:hypothetical protein
LKKSSAMLGHAVDQPLAELRDLAAHLACTV